MSSETEKHTAKQSNGSQEAPASGSQKRVTARATARKYNHLFAIHAESKASPLSSQDAAETPSFVGFRNLMVLMLCMTSGALLIPAQADWSDSSGLKYAIDD